MTASCSIGYRALIVNSQQRAFRLWYPPASSVPGPSKLCIPSQSSSHTPVYFSSLKRLSSPKMWRSSLRRPKRIPLRRTPLPSHRRRKPLEIRRHASRRQKRHSTGHVRHRWSVTSWRGRRGKRRERGHAAAAWGRHEGRRSAGTALGHVEGGWGHACCEVC